MSNYLERVREVAKDFKHITVTTEHMIYSMCYEREFVEAFEKCNGFKI